MNDAVWDYEKICPKCKEKGKKVKLKDYNEESRQCPECLIIYFVVKNPEER
jgi:hypothetical protein